VLVVARRATSHQITAAAAISAGAMMNAALSGRRIFLEDGTSLI
jgi:uncharacterized metal-binding protein